MTSVPDVLAVCAGDGLSAPLVTCRIPQQTKISKH